jgi:hypothetical protein
VERRKNALSNMYWITRFLVILSVWVNSTKGKLQSVVAQMLYVARHLNYQIRVGVQESQCLEQKDIPDLNL